MLLYFASALAATPTWELHAQGSGGEVDQLEERLIGAGGAVGLELLRAPRLQPELAVDLGGAPFTLDARAELRAFLSPVDDPRLRLSASAGYGLRMQGGLAPRGALGLAVDLPSAGPLRPRVGVRYLVDGVEPSAMQLTLGVVRYTPPAPLTERPPEEPPEEPLAAERPLPEVLRVAPKGSVVWIPHPVCRWVDVTEAQALLAALPDGTVVRVVAPDGSTELVTLGGGPIDVTLPERAPQGALVIAAFPDDRVRVGEVGVALADDGVAVMTTQPGLVALDLVGGGREQQLKLVLVDGMVVWVRPEPPPPTRIRFVVGESQITPEAAAILEGLASDRGDWGLRIQGSFSAEGSLESNTALAQQRSEAVAAWLRAQGMPEEDIVIEPPRVSPDPTLSIDDQRASLITPIRPGEER